MKSLLFLDTETTGLDEGRLIELAYAIESEPIYTMRVRPPVRIDFDAMMTHHITEAQVINYPNFQETKEYPFIKDTFEDSIIVAHNAPYDIGVLNREGIETGEFIDTLRVAQHLYPESKMHKLQYLRYSLGCNVEGKTDAHSAEGDVRVLMAVFRKTVTDAYKKYDLMSDSDAYKKLIELSRTPVMLEKMSFGKYRDMRFSEINQVDHQYIEWIYKKKSTERDADPSLVFTLEYWAKRRTV